MHRSKFKLVFLVAGLVACRPDATRVPGPHDPHAALVAVRARLEANADDRAAQHDALLLSWAWLGERSEARDLAKKLSKSCSAEASSLCATDGNAYDALVQLVQLIMADAELDTAAVVRHATSIIETLAKAHGAQTPQGLVAAAEFAARHLTAHEGQPDETARFIAFYESLDIAALPYVVRQPLISHRAAIARRLGEPFRPYFAQEGCVQAWQGTDVLGRLGVSELERHPDVTYRTDSAGAIVPLACATRVWNPTPRAGIRRLRTFIEAGPEPVILDLDTEHPAVVRLDGIVIHRSDSTDHFVSRLRRIEVDLDAGWHELEVEVPVLGERTWVIVRATGRDGAPVPVTAEPPGVRGARFTAPPRSLEPSFEPLVNSANAWIAEPLRRYMELDRALADRRSDDAEFVSLQLAAFPRFGEGHLLRARFERADPSRPQTVSAAREQKALRAALAVAPELDAARMRWLELRLERGETNEVVVALDEHPEALAGIPGELFRFRAQRAKGNEHLALEALARAKSQSPEHCGVLAAELTVARERDDTRREEALVGALTPCSGSLTIRAALAEKRGERDDAIRIWKDVLDRVPDDLDAIETLARLVEAGGDDKEAMRWWARETDLNPLRANATVRRADLAFVQGETDTARQILRGALEHHPQSDSLRKAAETLGIPDDLLRYRVDGLDILRSYQALPSAYEGVSEVLVLDRSVARVYPNGAQRHIVHLLVHLLNKDALDRYGEVDVPDRARLLTLRSIKPDGRILEPEVVSGKDGVELRHLEVGDFVDYEFIVEQPPTPELGDAVDVTAFRFQSLDIPYHRSELFVVFPTQMPMRVDRRANPPDAAVRTFVDDGEDLTEWHFRADRVPRLGVEAGHGPLLDEVPNVRIYTTPDLKAWLGRIAATLRPAQRSNPALRRLARTLVRGHVEPRAKLAALWRWVVESIEDTGDLSTPATVTLAGRRGNRMMLLHALALSVGIPTELWLMRDAHGPAPLSDGNPMFESFDTPVLVANDGTQTPWVAMTASKVMPIGYLPPGYARTEALRIPLDETHDRPVRARMPDVPRGLADRRSWTLSMELDAEGRAKVDGQIVMHGMEAISWRQALRDIDRDRVEELFQTTELAWLRGSTLGKLEITHEDELDQPLTFRFTADAEGVALRQGDALVMRSVSLPINIAARYAGLTERKTSLVIPYAPDQDAEIRITLRGARLDEGPAPLELNSNWGSFVREVETKDTEILVRVHAHLQPGTVPADAYPALADYARQVDVALQAPLRARVRGSAGSPSR